MPEIRSPLPGSFYRRPAPGQPPFKEIGDRVEPGDVIGLVEVMKSFNEIRADVAGTILSFAVEDEEPVMAGAVLVELEG
ncbi:biotin attachment protein [Azospirillum sp. TSH100]|uniref:acetyl-CoA carboxylase n=1 Tax=Azospirillum sp. TSH100 TaxID=652764 RepID=UPI000D608366|nr:acetyl-CoA carboxylase [Azospirillum sp. TSH100]PWC87037.1 biotin attachment protein [Azospirillum sp. TSH100]QCG91460.1 biotin carboxyl carrier domain-containing protein [Azospirillum sp. TSH100]